MLQSLTCTNIGCSHKQSRLGCEDPNNAAAVGTEAWWTAVSSLGCGSCQQCTARGISRGVNWHPLHFSQSSSACSSCVVLQIVPSAGGQFVQYQACLDLLLLLLLLSYVLLCSVLQARMAT